jgi:hypothetical protein
MKNKMVYVALLMGLLTIYCSTDLTDRSVVFFGAYTAEIIENKKDVPIFQTGAPLVLRRNHHVQLPLRLEGTELDKLSKGQVVSSDDGYKLLINTVDSTLTGEWKITDLTVDTISNSDQFARRFKASNDFYLIQFELLMRMDRSPVE